MYISTREIEKVVTRWGYGSPVEYLLCMCDAMCLIPGEKKAKGRVGRKGMVIKGIGGKGKRKIRRKRGKRKRMKGKEEETPPPLS